MNDQSEEIVDYKLIFKKYFFSIAFWIDLISIFPITGILYKYLIRYKYYFINF
jgi:hypothetical protein